MDEACSLTKPVIGRGGKSGSSRKSDQIRTGFWGILGVDSLSVEVGRRSTCVIGVSAIHGARAPTCRLVVLECGICDSDLETNHDARRVFSPSPCERESKMCLDFKRRQPSSQLGPYGPCALLVKVLLGLANPSRIS